ncbi:lysophospholipid acyltransferase family protein [Hyalangium sp.]|uniref:lysophospholipid acyltransferase family protein n=1 Tax=Hyalangium sp. TaxID=2028555 RepID=UPI002D752751|nr:lysophospholipid acyltransferase family protein [Hyalangium sp.]HYH96875.1 lysophospholipid acyltransferase family protein [Hyalangium sp.]
MLEVWLRRLVSFTAYGVLASLVLGLFPLWAMLVLLVDVLSGGAARLPRLRALACVALYLACELVGLAAAGAIWLGTLGGRLITAAQYEEANAALQRRWTETLLRGGAALFQMKLRIEGQECVQRTPFLLFVRHSSTADTLVAAVAVANPFKILLKYVLKRELLWDPCLDVVGRRLPNVFVDRSGERGKAEVDAVASLADGLGERQAVLIYPEGTRFSPKKLEASVARLTQEGRTELARIAQGYQHVLPPRLGGPLKLLEHAPGLDVVLLEQTGFEGAVSLAHFWRGAFIGRTIELRLRRVAAGDIPHEQRDLWLFEQWRETDRWITERIVAREGR